MMRTTALLLAAAALLPASAALASPNCTDEPQSKWMSEEAMRTRVTEMGYERIRSLETTGSCYEIYGYTRAGERAEVYFNPVTGAVVQSEIGG